MDKLRKLLITGGFVAMIIILSSCNKQEIGSNDDVIKTTMKDYLNSLNAFSFSTVDEITGDNEHYLKSAKTWDCLNVTTHPNETGEFWPRSWTFDYGTENCECYLGINRRGKMHVSLSDWWRKEGSIREITFEDFYFNDIKLLGVKTYLNTGINEKGNLTFLVKVQDAQLTYGDTATLSWNAEKYSELIEGNETFRFADDVWSVTGGGTGVNIDGKNYTFTITSALIYKNGCFHPVSGIIEFTVPNEENNVINYGAGGCDKIATVTIGGVTEEIEL